MNKKGFSLGEVLCAMAIVGIISVLALTIMKPSKKAIKYQYINAYNALNKAYYNGLTRGYSPFTTLKVDGADPVHSDDKDTGALQLCRGLTTFINTPTNEKGVDKDGRSYDYSSSCSDTKLASELGTEFLSTDNMPTAEKQQALAEREAKVQFVASNGMKFYISKLLGDAELKFYLVYVDINGDTKPNSIEYKYYKNGTVQSEPDIHAFAILESGRVIPIGAAEYDPNILTAKVAYFDDDGNVQYTAKSEAYYRAKGQAWGYYSSISTESASSVYEDAEFYSMNDVVRSKIDPNSILITSFPDLSTLSPLAVLDNDVNKCSSEDLESCYILLDEYRPY